MRCFWSKPLKPDRLNCGARDASQCRARWANNVDGFIGRVTFMRIKWTLMRCFLSPRILFSRNFGSSWRCNFDWMINIANITLSEVNITDLYIRQFSGIVGTKGITLKTFRLSAVASPLVEFRNGSAPNTLLPCASQTRSIWWRPSIFKVHNVINSIVCGNYYSLNSNRHLMKRANLIQKSISRKKQKTEKSNPNLAKFTHSHQIMRLCSAGAEKSHTQNRKWGNENEFWRAALANPKCSIARIHTNTRVAIKKKQAKCTLLATPCTPIHHEILRNNFHFTRATD